MIDAHSVNIKSLDRGSRSNVFFYLFFLVWPLGVLLASLKHWRTYLARNIFWLFCIYFGFAFIVAAEGADSARYAQILVEFNRSGISWDSLLKSFYSETNFIDIVQPLLTFFVAAFTDNPNILFAVFGLVFGFFYSRNLWYILGRIEKKVSFSIILIIISFVLLNPIWNINGFRMYAAAQVFIYGLLPYLYEGKKKSLLWCFSSIFFHFSFIFPVLILGTYILLGNRLYIYFVFFIVSKFIQGLDLGIIRKFSDFLPTLLQPKVTSYTNPGYVLRVNQAVEALNWYVRISNDVITWIVYFLSVAIFLKRKNHPQGKMLNLFCFGLWFYSWANLSSHVPSGARFLIIANIIMLAFLILFLLSSNDNILHKLSLISAPGLILYIIVSTRSSFDFIGISTLLGNPVQTMIYHDTTPLITYIKDLF
jgi:hypothetical protein